MSALASVRSIAASVGIPELNDQAGRALTADVEYRMREVIQEACKFRRRTPGRQELTVDDVNRALRMRNIQPIYGVGIPSATMFKRVPLKESGGAYALDRELSVQDQLSAPLPSVPLQPYCAGHWLLINGVVPGIPENEQQVPNEPLPDQLLPGMRSSTGVRRLKDSVSNELLQYFCRVCEALLQRDEATLQPALLSLSQDSIALLLPYFVEFVAAEVPQRIRELPILRNIVSAVEAMHCNGNLPLQAYVPHLLQPLVMCVTGAQLGEPGEDHWALRRAAAATLASVCRLLGRPTEGSIAKLTVKLLDLLKPENQNLGSQFGAVTCLTMLGPEAIECLFRPVDNAPLVRLAQCIAKQLRDSDTLSAVRSVELQRLWAALLRAAQVGVPHAGAVCKTEDNLRKLEATICGLFGDALRATLVSCNQTKK
eukprot:TRINITY_DN55837_c0_g1_i1.p1 TRINITY_DN55837_c0_g1~~TRINITY_DN55837_c0_g1_i1.p1  ORF type:complete len:427 (+),score=48.29 TRINITY_DN55837_c0_g1_i1:25-1305(+)